MLLLTNQREKKTKILPININIIPRCYQYVSYAISIASNHTNFEEWFVDNYIQLFFDKDNIGRNIMLDYLGGTIFDSMQLLNYRDYEVEKRFLIDGKNILNFVENSINCNMYICTYLDEYYIKDRVSYKIKHFEHDTLIYGYDFSNGYIYIVGYNHLGRYETQAIPIDDFINAFKTKDELLKQICLNHNVYTYDLDRVKKMLSDYVYHVDNRTKLECYLDLSTDSFLVGKLRYHKNFVFGINIYDGIKEYINYLFFFNTDLDTRLFYTLYEHKLCMVKRFNLIAKFTQIDMSDTLSRYQEMLKHSQLILRLGIKYEITKEKKLLLKMSELIDEIVEKEVNCLINVITTVK